MTLKKFQVGEFASFTQENFQTIQNGSRSIKAYPCQNFVDKVKKYIGQICKVTHTWEVGHDATVQFDDGQSFHFKGHWISEIKA